SHLTIFNVDTKKVDSVTSSDVFDDGSPAWSPDGQRIAFVRTPTNDPTQLENGDVWVVDARAGATPKQLTNFPGGDDGRLSWSPDGKLIAFLRGDEPKWYAYNLSKVAIVPADGSAPARVVTASFDRPLFQLQFSSD